MSRARSQIDSSFGSLLVLIREDSSAGQFEGIDAFPQKIFAGIEGFD